EPPLWAALMASFCRRAGLSVELIDGEAEGLSPEELAQRTRDADALLVAVVVYGHQPSASTQAMTAAGAVCTAVKRSSPKQQVTLVGGHVAALPARTLDEEDVDFVAAGEGLHTLVALGQALRSPVPNLANVPGLWYRDDGRPRVTPDRPLVENLDESVPRPAWDLLPMARYR